MSGQDLELARLEQTLDLVARDDWFCRVNNSVFS